MPRRAMAGGGEARRPGGRRWVLPGQRPGLRGRVSFWVPFDCGPGLCVRGVRWAPQASGRGGAQVSSGGLCGQMCMTEEARTCRGVQKPCQQTVSGRLDSHTQKTQSETRLLARAACKDKRKVHRRPNGEAGNRKTRRKHRQETPALVLVSSPLTRLLGQGKREKVNGLTSH